MNVNELSSFHTSGANNFEVAHEVLENMSILDFRHHYHFVSEKAKRTKLHAGHYSAELENAWSFSAITQTPYVKIYQKSHMASEFDLGTACV